MADQIICSEDDELICNAYDFVWDVMEMSLPSTTFLENSQKSSLTSEEFKFGLANSGRAK